MTYAQGIRLASRTIALYLFVTAATSALALPFAVMTTLEIANLGRIENRIPALSNSASLTVVPAAPRPMRPFSDASSRVRRSSWNVLIAEILRLAIYLAAGILFYRSGPLIQRFFGPAPEATGRPQP